MTIRKGKALAVAAASAAILAAAGCGSTHTASPSSSQPSTTAPSPSVSSPMVPTPTPTPTPTPPSVQHFGSGAFTYENGLKVQVPTPVKFTPSDTAAGTHAGQTGVLVTVTITNSSGAQIDLALAQVKVTSGSAGNQADSIFDSAQDIGSGFSGSVLPGHSQSAKFAFSVAPSDLSDVVVQVTPGFNYQPVSFEGSVS
jgi:maltose-binding protein MalE